MKASKRTFSLMLVLVFVCSCIQLPAVVSADSDTFYAVEDTFTAAGDAAAVNNTNQYLYVRSQPSQDRYAYIKFDASSIAGATVRSAKLKLYFVHDASADWAGINTPTGNVPVTGFVDTSWDGSKLNWSNQNTMVDTTDETELGTLNLNGYDKYYEIDVTDFVNSMEDKKFTFKIAGDKENNGKAYKFASNEYTEVTMPPVLEVEYDNTTLPVTGVSIEEESIDLRTGDDDYALNWSISPKYATNKNVTWISDNPSVATVVNGVVTPVGVGTAKITVTTEEGGFSDTCDVNVALGRLTEKLFSSADTYISQGNPTANSQQEPYLYVRSQGDPTSEGGQNRHAFLKFDASELDVDYIVGAKLNLYYFKDTSSQATIDASAVNGGDLPVYGLKDSSWNASTNITWSNNVPNPSGQTELGNLTVASEADGGFDKFYSIDVTDYIKTKTDRTYAFRIEGDPKNDAKAYKFRSFDCEDRAQRPYLTILYNPPGIDVQEIILDQTTLNLNTSDYPVTLNATVEPYNATNQTLSWTSSKPEVATVTNEGKVIVVGVGQTDITVSCGGKSAVCKVTVAQGRERAKVYATADTYTDMGIPTQAMSESGQLYARANPNQQREIYINVNCEDYADKNIAEAKLYLYYYKDTSSQAVINITATNGGELPVYGLMSNSWANNIGELTFANRDDYFGGIQTKSIGKLVVDSEENGGFDQYYSIDVTEYIKEMGGSNFSFKIEGDSKDGGLAYKFRSANHAVTSQQPYLEIFYNPDGIDIEDVVLDKTMIEMEIGNAPQKIHATVLPELASNPNLTWTSSKPGVATVDGYGVVTPVGVGETVITVKSADGKITRTCTVYVDQPLETTKLAPTMDTFLDQGNPAVAPYASTELYARQQGNGQDRYIYMQFDLIDIMDRNIESAKVNLYYYKFDAAGTDEGGELPVIGLNEDGWNDKLLMASDPTSIPDEDNAVSIGSLVLDSAENDGYNRYYSIDITDFIKSQEDELVSLKIKGDPMHSGKGYKFRSSEYENADMRPYLEVKFAPENTPVKGIALDKTTITATTGDEPIQLNKRFTPKYPSNTNVTWSSDNTKVATVSDKGLVTPVGAGTAVITVKTEDGGYTATCTVNVQPGLIIQTIGMAADTFVNAPNTGYTTPQGATTDLYAKYNEAYQQTRSIYLKTEDYSNIAMNTVDSAILYLTCNGSTVAPNGGTLPVYALKTNDWEESILWETQPVAESKPDETNATYIGDILVPASPVAGTVVAIDITEYLKANGGAQSSFMILGDSENPDNNGAYHFYSKEFENDAYKPYIKITSKEADPNMNITYSYKTSAGSDADSWTAGGKVQVDASIAKDALAGLNSITVLCGIYEKSSGKLVDMVTVNQAVNANGNTDVRATLSNLPAGPSNYMIKTFIWADLANISPVMNNTVYYPN